MFRNKRNFLWIISLMLTATICLSLIKVVPSLAEVITINFWHNYTGAGEVVLKEMIKEFESQHPNIKVNATFVAITGSYAQMSEKVLTAIAGGNPPDVMVFNRPYISEWAMNGALIPLDEYVKKANITKNMYYSFSWNECLYKGRIYGLPLNTDTRAFYYNKKLFREVGFDPEKPPKFIDELDAMAEKLNKIVGTRIERIGFVPWLFQGYYLFCWTPTFNGRIYDPAKERIVVDHPNNIAVFEWFRKYAEKYNVSYLDTFSSGFGTEAADPFIMEKVAMKLDGDWALETIRRYAPNLDFGVTFIPRPSFGKEKATYAGGWGIVIPKGAKHVDEAFEWAKFWAGERAQLKYCEATYLIPTHKRAASNKVFYKDPNHAIFMNLLPYATGRPAIPVLGTLWDEIKAATDFVKYGKKTPRQALEDIVKTVQPQLDKALGKIK